MIKSVEVREGPASRRGVEYEVANGIRIPNLGENKFQAATGEGLVRSVTAHVFEVNKPFVESQQSDESWKSSHLRRSRFVH